MNRNVSEAYGAVARNRLEGIKAKIRQEKYKILLEIKKGDRIKNEIFDLLLELNEAGVIDDAEKVGMFMNDVDEKYGLKYEGESEMSKLFTEIINAYQNESYRDDDDDEHDEDVDYDFDDNDDYEYDINTIYFEKIQQLLDSAETKFVLCKSLLNRVELSNFEHTMLRDRLEEMKRRKMSLLKFQKETEEEQGLDDFCY